MSRNERLFQIHRFIGLMIEKAKAVKLFVSSFQTEKGKKKKKKKGGKWALLLALVIVNAGHDLHSCLSFSAKQASRLRKSQIRTRELETHRNRSLCSHDLIRHGGAGLSGSGAACCTDGKSKSNLRRERDRAENYAAVGPSCSAMKTH